MSHVKLVALRDFAIYEPAVPPSEKETRREFRAGDPVEVTAERAADWRARGLIGEPPSLPKEQTPEE